MSKQMKIKINKFFNDDGKPIISIHEDCRIPNLILGRYCKHTPENIAKLKIDFFKMLLDNKVRQAS